MARPSVYNRRSQPDVKFKTDEMTKKLLQNIAASEGVSLNVFLEELVKKEILKRNIESIV